MFTQIGIITASLATLSLYEGIRSIGGFRRNSLDTGMYLYLMFASGFLFPQISYNWSNGLWSPIVNSSFAAYLYISAILYFLIRIDMLILISYREAEYFDTRHRVTSLGFILATLGVMITLLELVWASSIYFSLTIATAGLFIFTMGYFSNPYILSLKSFGIQYLLISDKETGTPIFVLHDDSGDFKYSPTLYSGWLKGIIDVLNEFTHDIIFEKLQFKNHYLLIYQSYNLIAYLFVKRDSYLIYEILKKLTNILQEDEVKFFKFTDNQVSIDKINSIMRQSIL